MTDAIPFAPLTVVVPCFRCAATIERAIQSVAAQTLRPAEVVLVEDGSGDDTAIVLRRLALLYPNWVKVIELMENVGAASARNLGWQTASQPYIAFLDADDAWHPKKVEIQYGYMSAHTEIALSGHAHRVVNANSGIPTWAVEPVRVLPISKTAMLLSNRFVTPSVMMKRETQFRFAAGRRHMEDHLLWMELVCAGIKTVRLDVELVAIFKPSYGASGLSAQLWAMEIGELQNYRQLRIVGEIGLLAWFGLTIFSIAKFLRRLIVVWGYVRWKRR